MDPWNIQKVKEAKTVYKWQKNLCVYNYCYSQKA